MQRFIDAVLRRHIHEQHVVVHGTEAFDLYPHRAADHTRDRRSVRELELDRVQLVEVPQSLPSNGRKHQVGGAGFDQSEDRKKGSVPFLISVPFLMARRESRGPRHICLDCFFRFPSVCTNSSSGELQIYSTRCSQQCRDCILSRMCHFLSYPRTYEQITC